MTKGGNFQAKFLKNCPNFPELDMDVWITSHPGGFGEVKCKTHGLEQP